MLYETLGQLFDLDGLISLVLNLIRNCFCFLDCNIDKKLLNLADKIKPENNLPLAVNLDLGATFYEKLFHKHHGNSYPISFEILKTYYNRGCENWPEAVLNLKWSLGQIRRNDLVVLVDKLQL